jgi:AraC-like DNA-binding protein
MAVPVASIATQGAGGYAGRVTSTYTEWKPPRAFEGRPIDCIWRGEAGWRRSLRLLPDACVDLVWNNDKVEVVSPTATAVRYEIQCTTPTIGVRLAPGWAASFLGVPIGILPPVIDLSDVWRPKRARRLELMLGKGSCDTFSADKIFVETSSFLPARRDVDPAVTTSVTLLREPESSVQMAANKVGISGRQLRRRFIDEVGLNPKTFQTISRFQRFWRISNSATSSSLAQIAVTCGYADQAHLSRDCHRMAWTTPARLVASGRMN